MPHRVIFALQKGGVGKTSSTVVVSEILAAAGYKVLVVDFDSQGNSTKILTQESIYTYTGHTIMEAVKQGDAKPYIVHVKDNLDLIPAEDKLSTFSRHIYTSRTQNPYAVLKRLLEPLEASYDFVFVDTGPSLGDTVINAIVYADDIIVPVDLGDLAMDAMVRFIEFVEATRDEGHTKADILGILLTMKDGRTKYERDIGDGIREGYGSLVFNSEIRRRVRIKEISARGVDLNEPAMEDYYSLVEEMIDRLNQKEDRP